MARANADSQESLACMEKDGMMETAQTQWTMDLQEVSDRIAIRECIDRFSLAMTQADAAAITPLFLPEGSWGSGAPFTFTISGAEAIGAAIASNKSHFEFSVHMVHSVVIDLDGDRASARTVLQEITRSADGEGGMTCQGIYHDKLQRTSSGWRFASRMFETVCLDRTPSVSRRIAG
jgi:hypothetical protein